MQHHIQQYNQQQLSNKNDHIHYDLDEDDQNLTPKPKTYQNTYQDKPEIQLENIIMEKINSTIKEQDLISKQLEIKLDKLLEEILFSNGNQEEKLKMRMHQLALSKILVNTHSKSQFYLVKAHHHLGQAYLNYKCYQQALDHLTMSLKKNAKINDMNEIKLYHSYVLTTYSRCYFEISSYDDALQILKKAYDIQLGCENQSNKIDNIQTLRLISNCHLKLKNYKQALQYIQKVQQIITGRKGKKSKQYAKILIQKSKILICQQKTYQQAISTLQQGIDILEEIKYQNQIQIADYYQLLSEFYSKVNNHSKQVQILYKKLDIYTIKYQEGHQKTLKIKKQIALLLQKYNRISQAVKELQQILDYEEKLYPQNKVQMGKTLKALGLCYLTIDNKLNQSEQCLKKAHKLLSQHGVGKSIKEIKSKLQQIKDKKQGNKILKEQFKIIQKQLHQQPFGVAH